MLSLGLAPPSFNPMSIRKLAYVTIIFVGAAACVATPAFAQRRPRPPIIVAPPTDPIPDRPSTNVPAQNSGNLFLANPVTSGKAPVSSGTPSPGAPSSLVTGTTDIGP